VAEDRPAVIRQVIQRRSIALVNLNGKKLQTKLSQPSNLDSKQMFGGALECWLDSWCAIVDRFKDTCLSMNMELKVHLA
jgi:hypothetical protein